MMPTICGSDRAWQTVDAMLKLLLVPHALLQAAQLQRRTPPPSAYQPKASRCKPECTRDSACAAGINF